MSKEVFEMPVPIGGKIYDIDFHGTPCYVIGYRIGRMMGEDEDEYEDDGYDDGQWYVQYEFCGISSSTALSELGKSIFLTREEMIKAKLNGAEEAEEIRTIQIEEEK